MKHRINASKLLTEPNPTNALHSRIMSMIVFSRVRKPVLAVTAFAALNIILTGWQIWKRLIENEAIEMIKNFFGEFEASADFFSQFFGALRPILPVGLLLTLSTSAALLITGMIVFLNVRNMTHERSFHGINPKKTHV